MASPPQSDFNGVKMNNLNMENGDGSDGTGTGLPEKVAFPPPALWYKTNATASRDDMWAYLSNQQIVLVRPKQTFTRFDPDAKSEEVGSSQEEEDTSSWPSFEVFGFQKEGYHCLSFCQNAWTFLPVKESPLVTGCRDGFVRIWNVSTGQCVMYHDVHKEAKSTPVTCVEWCSRNPKVIYSMDEDGTLVSWYLPKALLKSFSFGKIAPTSIHSCPFEDNLLCFGSKGGNIYIVKTDPSGKATANIIHKVRHDEELIATLWCPTQSWRMSKGEGQEQAIFASAIQSIKNPTIRLWGRNAEDRGIYQLGEKEKSNFGKVYRNFSPLLWVTDPNSGEPFLVTANKKGEIIYFMKDSTIYDFLHNLHNSSVFGLVQCGDILWSTSYEPVIVGYNLRSMSTHCVIPTFRGVCAMTPSLSIGTLVGIGGADGCIRALDFTKDYPMKGSAKEPHVSFRLRSKILSLAWHPYKDNWLGFGTDDGVIGVYEIHESQKHLKQFERHVKGAVYAVDWGPRVSFKGNEKQEVEGEEGKSRKNLCLYACGGNKVFSVHPGNLKNPLVDILHIIKTSNKDNIRRGGLLGGDSDQEGDGGQAAPTTTLISKAADIRWSPDFSLFAVGYNDGRVELYSPPFLQLKCWIKCHSRAIQYLSWRPTDFMYQLESDSEPEVQEGGDKWFATCSNDGTCRLFNLGTLFKKEFLSNEDIEPKLIISAAATLRSPNGERMISSAWSPHDPKLIMTVSYDSTGILWDITTGTPIARYFGHGHRLVACCFHPASEFLIMTASDEIMYDFTLHVWDYREHPYQDALDASESEKKVKSRPLHIKGKEQELTTNGTSVDPEEQPTSSKKKDLSSHIHVVNESLVASVIVGSQPQSKVGSRGQKQRSSKGSKSLLPFSANAFINNKLPLEEEIRYIVDVLVDKEKRITAQGLEPGTPELNGSSQGSSIGSSQEDALDELLEGEVMPVPNSSTISVALNYLHILGDYDQCVELLKDECESHAKKGDWEKGCLLASWMGYEEFLERAINSSQITETILNISRDKSSKPLFKRACTLLAEKFILEEDYSKGATYLLQAGLKENAVQLLVDHKLYRDAVALMKMVLPKKNPMHFEVTKKWLIQLTVDGNFEVACKIYTSLRMYEDALATIEKRDTAYAWVTGIYLASKCGDLNKMEFLALKYCIDSMGKMEHSSAKFVISKYQNLRWLLPLILIHESIFHLSNKLRDGAMKCEEGEVGEMWEVGAWPKGEFKKNLMNSVGMDALRDEEILRKLRDTVVITVAQNKSDAEVILIRSLALILLGELVGEEVEQECIKLTGTWLKEKDIFLCNAYVFALNDLK